MKDIKDYEEYNALFNDDLVVAVRKVLMQIEDPKYIEEIDEYWTMPDSTEHGVLIDYFNKFGLHRKLSEKQFENWKS